MAAEHNSYMYQLYWCCLIVLVNVTSEFAPAVYIPTKTSECGFNFQDNEEIVNTLLQDIQQQIGPPGCNPPSNRSCQDILQCFPMAPSGYYQLSGLADDDHEQVYCDMEGTNCGGERGWTRVAYVNMTQPGATCPNGLTQRNFSGTLLCGRSIIGCQSAAFSALGVSYSSVCGRLQGYQYYHPDAFYASITNMQVTIDGIYVDGVSITHGSGPRKHIWTYAVGAYPNRLLQLECPCNNGSSFQSPSFIGNDYYCESASYKPCPTCHRTSVLYDEDLLWDGQQCSSLEATCCTHPNMPWFTKALGETTTDDIEVRVCGNESPTGDEDTPLSLIELFVK